MVLVWTAVALLEIFVVLPIADATPFTDKAACDAFAEAHKERMIDFARGALNLDWAVEVRIGWQCEPAGEPA